MSEIFGMRISRKEALKELIKKIHQGEDPEVLKRQFKQMFGSVTPTEIAQIEEELIKEGLPREEVVRLCEVHLAVFQESLEKGPEGGAGNPITILMEEHKALLEFADKLKNTLEEMRNIKDYEEGKEKLNELQDIVNHFKESEKHYLREENVLFPYLEKHGITEPPAIMWMDHDKIRAIKKDIYKLIDTHKNISPEEFVRKLAILATDLSEMLSSHFYKENNILFPMALHVLSEDELKDIRLQFDEIGYCCFTPPSVLTPIEKTEEKELEKKEGMVNLPTGSFTLEELEAVLNTLPVDITFVDKNDEVRYFSETKDRIFVRTKAVIGRKVQQCHPQKSVHIVEKIVNEFKKGTKDHADFWINLNGRLILIRYFAVRDKNGNYLGTLEVTQDITDIKKIEGEKRLLDWE
jgi:PAS domain S-box-containing protein